MNNHVICCVSQNLHMTVSDGPVDFLKKIILALSHTFKERKKEESEGGK